MRQPRILLVEDNEDNRTVFATMLRHYGYEVVEAIDGPAGLHAALSTTPDLILMDLSIPALDGWQVTQQLKSDARTSRIPVVAVTAHALKDVRERAFRSGFDGFVAKPCQAKHLLQEIQRFLPPPAPLLTQSS